MKKERIQQEILLVANTTFANKQLCARDAQEPNNHLSKAEQLEVACWDGLLDELMPEIMEKTASGKRLNLWHIRHGASFLQIELSEFPLTLEKEYSINAAQFLSPIQNN